MTAVTSKAVQHYRTAMKELEAYATPIVKQVLLRVGRAVAFLNEGDWDPTQKDAVVFIDGNKEDLEFKHRFKLYDDLFVEIEEDVPSHRRGWFLYLENLRTIIAYSMFDQEYGRLQKLYVFYFRALRKWIEDPANASRFTEKTFWNTQGRGCPRAYLPEIHDLLADGVIKEVHFEQSWIVYPPEFRG